MKHYKTTGTVKTSGTVSSGTSTVYNTNFIKILRVLSTNPEGLRVKTIQRLTGLARRTTYNNLNQMQLLNLTTNVYPIWKLIRPIALSSKWHTLLSNDNIQSHKFSFIMRLVHKPKWWEKRNNQLMKLKEFHFKPIDWSANNPYQQLVRDNFIIQTFSNSIVFINQKNYCGEDSYECFIKALEDTLQMYNFVEERFHFKFFKEGVPQLSVRTHHYVQLRDALANRCKKDKTKFELVINGVRRAWVDMSEPFGLEFGSKNHAPEDARVWNERVKDVIVNNPSLPSDIDSRLEKLTNIMEGSVTNQSYYAENMRTHVDAVKDLAKGVNELRKEVKRLRG